MQLVLDANCFSDPRLANFLSKRKAHKVVFNEYAMIEAYKGNALKNIVESYRIVAQYPDQVKMYLMLQLLWLARHPGEKCGLATNRNAGPDTG